MLSTTTTSTARRRAQKPLWPFALNKDCDLSQGVVGWWTADALADDQLLDLSTINQNNMILTGNPKITGGGPDGGSALQFLSASSQSADAALPAQLIAPYTSGVTMACWTMPFTTSNQPCVGLTSSASATLRLCIRAFATATGVRFQSAGGGTTVNVDTTFAPTQYGWNLCIGSAANLATQTIYLNSRPTAGNNNVISFPSTMNTASMGRTKNTASAFYDGLISEFILWNRAITSTEMLSLWDPSTRWQLRYQLGKAKWFLGQAAAAATAQVWPYLDTELEGGLSSLGMGGL
jgi:hypothetical protein